MKAIRLMGTTLLLLLTLKGTSQSNTPLLDRNVSLNFSSVSLQEALFALSEKADFNLSFNSGILPSESSISFQCEEKKLSEVFSYLLPEEIDIKTSGNSVVLLKKAAKRAKKKEISLKGKVMDSGSGKPISDATVLDIHGSQSVLTDTTGNFQLQFNHKQEELVLSISKTGYKDSSVLLMPESQEMLLYLRHIERPKAVQLNKIESIPLQKVEVYPLSKLMIPKLLMTHAENIQGYTKRIFQLSLTPGTSSNLKIAGTVKNAVSINLMGGYNYGVAFFELGGAFNINRTDVSGLQIAGMANLVGGKVSGLQISGGINRTKGKQYGTQVSGFGNFNADDFYGLQLSGGFNLAHNLIGPQIAGVANSADSLSGVQLSPAYNKSNYLKGLQLSSGLNVCKTMKGVQIGIVNRAKQQNGFQLGLININDSSEGVSIGLITFVKDRKALRAEERRGNQSENDPKAGEQGQ